MTKGSFIEYVHKISVFLTSSRLQNDIILLDEKPIGTAYALGTYGTRSEKHFFSYKNRVTLQ